MKIAKILSAAAACAVAATALAVSASAELTVAENPASNLSSATGMWMLKIYVPSENIDLGIDLCKIDTQINVLRRRRYCFLLRSCKHYSR